MSVGFEYTPKQRMMMNGLMVYHLDKHPEKQIIQTIQELAELIKTLTKYYGDNEPNNNLLEEIFDVDFMLMQMKKQIIYNNNLNHVYVEIVNGKLHREIVRHRIEL